MRYAILDLDDTLIATLDASFGAWVTTAGAAAPDRATFVSAYRGLTFEECVARWLGPVDLDAFTAAYLDAVDYQPIGDVAGLVARLRGNGAGSGVVTNSTGPQVELKLATAGIPADAFDFVAARARGGSQVKDLRKILAGRGIDPASAVHVSDNPADLGPSVTAGVPFRGVLTGAWVLEDFVAAGVDPADVHADVHAATWDLA